LGAGRPCHLPRGAGYALERLAVSMHIRGPVKSAHSETLDVGRLQPEVGGAIYLKDLINECDGVILGQSTRTNIRKALAA
jgi:hypothetical protein